MPGKLIRHKVFGDPSKGNHAVDLHDLVDTATIGDIDGSNFNAAYLNFLLTNDHVANALRTATTIVVIGGSAAPLPGQVLVATDNSSATWQTVSGTSLNGTGTVSTVAGNPGVIGVGTIFLTELKVGYLITIGSETRTVTAIADNTHLTASSNWTPTLNNVAWTYRVLSLIRPFDFVTTKAADYNITSSDVGAVILVDTSAGNVNVNLPAASSFLGVVTVIKLTGDANVVEIIPNGSDSINLKASAAGTGTAATTMATNTVVGTATVFTTQLKVGYLIKIGTETRKITLITDDTHLTVDSNWANTNAPMAFTFFPLAFITLSSLLSQNTIVSDRSASWFSLNSSSGVGSRLQLKRAQTAVQSTISTKIPFDNTIPQITEGSEILTVSLTPSSTSNRLIVRGSILASVSGSIGGPAQVIGALFQDAGVNAIATTFQGDATGLNRYHLCFALEIPAAVAAPTVIRLRLGMNATGNLYFNGDQTGTGLFGGTMFSYLEVEELQS